MRRATLAATLALATAACGSSTLPAGPIAHEVPHQEPRRPEAADPTQAAWQQLAAARPDLQRASRSATRPRPAPTNVDPNTPGGDGIALTSTAYCEHGLTASGRLTRSGTVAMNGVPFGSRWRVAETGNVYTVTDRIGHGSSFDIWLPDCNAARTYGRRTIHVERVA